MAITTVLPLIEYAPISQNSRVKGYEVPGDDQPYIFSTENLLDSTEINDLIEAAYRQIFFHAFKVDREAVLESQLKNGQITVRDFVRGLLLSDTYKRSFYDLNNNYRFVEQTVQRVLGRDVYSEREKIAWSIIVCQKGYIAFVDALLDSEEYMDNFGYDTLPYQRRRNLPGRDAGEVPFNLKSPRYEAYYRTIKGFPQMVYTGPIRRVGIRTPQVVAGDPGLFIEMARTITVGNRMSVTQGNADFNFLAKVPRR